MKLEVGKYYRTRDGRKVGPTIHTPMTGLENMQWNCVGGSGWTDAGTEFNCEDSMNDIIAEWTDAPGLVDESKRQSINKKYGIGTGKFLELSDSELIDRVQQAITSPVQLRKVIVSGVYGKVVVCDGDELCVVCDSMRTRADLIAARDVFNALIDAMDE